MMGQTTAWGMYLAVTKDHWVQRPATSFLDTYLGNVTSYVTIEITVTSCLLLLLFSLQQRIRINRVVHQQMNENVVYFSIKRFSSTLKKNEVNRNWSKINLGCTILSEVTISKETKNLMPSLLQNLANNICNQMYMWVQYNMKEGMVFLKVAGVCLKGHWWGLFFF